jgi:hypothetical protein
LTTKNVLAHVYYDEELDTYYYDWKKGEETIKLITRIGCRQTLANQWHPDWDYIQKRDRLLGVSMTGLVDALDLLKWGKTELSRFFAWCKRISVKEADRYHDSLGINHSARVTLMKPEGTISKLPGVSSGIHRSYAPYFYQRIRFSKTDPLATVLINLGINPVPENGQGDDLYAEKCNTWVFTFGIKSNTPIRAIDESALDQLERYRLAQVNYADRGHNTSATITLAPDEYDIAANWINDNWDDIIGVSFLPRFDPSEGGQAAYPNMPWEPCTKEQYEKVKDTLPLLTEEQLITLLSSIEKGYEEEEILEDKCGVGSCPLR